MVNKKLVIICILLITSIFAGCAENTDNLVSDMSSESTDSSISDIPTESRNKLSHIHDKNAQLCMDKVLFVANMQKYDNTDIMYYLVVMNDGNIFTMENNHKSDNYEFSDKFGSFDDSAWSLAEKLENIGSLSPEDAEKLSEYISEINPDSDEEGAYYEAYDKNALSALELIAGNQIYIDWRNKF